MQRLPPLLHREAEAGGHWRTGRALRAPVRSPRQEVALSLSTERRQALLQAKLAALIRGRWGNAEGTAGGFPGGAALVDGRGAGGAGGADHVGGIGGARAWVLAGGEPARSLGGSVAWALRRAVIELDLLVEADHETVGLLARRAAAFALPVSVWRVEGRDIQAAAPAPFPPILGLPDGVARFADVLASHGAEPVVEHGVLTGEVLGLEVARVVGRGVEARLEVGVGSQDRKAALLLRPDRPIDEALAAAVAAVREWRTSGPLTHPAATLASERWLRAALIARPDLVGATRLTPVAPTQPRRDLLQAHPAAAAGVDRDERPMLVLCSTGVDLDLVPAAADARLADPRDFVRLVLALPPGDDYPVTRALAAALEHPAEVVTVPAGWRALAQ